MNRRGFLTGVVGLLAAPAIVRATSIMPISAWPERKRAYLYVLTRRDGVGCLEWLRTGMQYDYDEGSKPFPGLFKESSREDRLNDIGDWSWHTPTPEYLRETPSTNWPFDPWPPEHPHPRSLTRCD